MVGYRIIGQDGLSVYLANVTNYEITNNMVVSFKRAGFSDAVFNFNLILGIVEYDADVQVRPPFDNTATVE